jgi:hypothetical protein
MTREEFRRSLPVPLSAPFSFHFIAAMNLSLQLILALCGIATWVGLAIVCWLIFCFWIAWFFGRRHLREKWTRYCEEVCRRKIGRVDYAVIAKELKREMEAHGP